MMKNSFLLCYLILAQSTCMLASDVVNTCDHDNRTELMNLVIKHEEQQKKILYDQWADENQILVRGFSLLVFGPLITILQDLANSNKVPRDYDQELRNLNIATSYAIQLMTLKELHFSAVDNKGWTALNYCESKEMYELLRLHGAPFQFDLFFSIYHYECINTAFGLVIASYGLLIGSIALEALNK